MVQQTDVNALLEYHDDVGAAEHEVAHVIATLQFLVDLQCGQPVDAAYLRHADRQHGDEAVLFGLDNGTGTGLNHLESHVVDVIVQFALIVPKRIAATSRYTWDGTQLYEASVNGCMVMVIAIDVKEGVR